MLMSNERNDLVIQQRELMLDHFDLIGPDHRSDRCFARELWFKVRWPATLRTVLALARTSERDPPRIVCPRR